MATKFKLKITTPHGEFTRVSATNYKYAVVRTSDRAERELATFQAETDPQRLRWLRSGVGGRWIKDRGFAVTWHTSECLATSAASKPYLWDRKCGPAEIYRVEADLPILAALLPRVG